MGHMAQGFLKWLLLWLLGAKEWLLSCKMRNSFKDGYLEKGMIHSFRATCLQLKEYKYVFLLY